MTEHDTLDPSTTAAIEQAREMARLRERAEAAERAAVLARKEGAAEATREADAIVQPHLDKIRDTAWRLCPERFPSSPGWTSAEECLGMLAATIERLRELLASQAARLVEAHGTAAHEANRADEARAALAAETARADAERARANEWLAQRADAVKALRDLLDRITAAPWIDCAEAVDYLARIDAAEAAPPRRFAAGDKVRVLCNYGRALAGTLRDVDHNLALPCIVDLDDGRWVLCRESGLAEPVTP